MESWKPIVGYEGYYEVSSLGRVRSLDRRVCSKDGSSYRNIKGKIKKLSEAKTREGQQGYLVVNLRKNKADIRTVHRLVAEAFIENPAHYEFVNHIDGNKHNNNINNLEWVTAKNNNIHALEHGLRSPKRNPVAQIFEDGSYKVFRSVSEAAVMTGISRGMISHCVHGRATLAGGYKWVLLKGVTTIPYGSTVDDELPLEVREQL